jgi:putative transposase
VTEALCGHSFSASSISTINKSLDEGLKAFAERRLNESYPYLILDARYEKVREAGVILSQAVLVAVAVDEDGRRQILAVELANRESRSSWRDFLSGLKGRGLAGVEFVVSDNHEGLKAAIREVLPEAAWQRCYVHFLRNALDYVPRKSLPSRKRGWTTTACRSCVGSEPVLGPAKPDPGDRRDLAEVRRDIAQWLAKWQAKYPRLCNWVEDHIEETLTYYRLPLPHHKHMKSTNMLERLNQELKRRTHVVRIFPNAESCLRLVRALAVEMHENWLEATRYLNMDHLKEHKKQALRALAA